MLTSALHRSDGLTLAEAAQRAGKSITWVRRKLRFGPLTPCHIGGRQGVTIVSLEALIFDIRERDRRRAVRNSSEPHLWLVVDNT